MRLLEFFNEAQEVQLKNPGTLQAVLDRFLAQSVETEPARGSEEEWTEGRIAVLRSRLEQSKEAGFDKHGKSPGFYGKLSLDADDMRAVAFALKSVGQPEEAEKLKSDLQGMRVEGISASGAEGLGGHGEGFEVQNQGVTRRAPGEGPKANGGRSQPQQFDSYDQPQFKNEMPKPEEMDSFVDAMAGVEGVPRDQGTSGYDFTNDNPMIGQAMGLDANRNRSPNKPPDKPVRLATSPQGGYDFTQDNPKLIDMLGLSQNEGQVQPAKGWDVQDPHQGSQEAGPIAMHEMFGNKTITVDPARVDVMKLLGLVNRNSSLYWNLMAARSQPASIDLDASEVEELRQALLPLSQDQRFNDVISQLHETKEIDAMKHSVRGMKHAVGKMSSRLKKSSEKKKPEPEPKAEGVVRLVEFYGLDTEE